MKSVPRGMRSGMFAATALLAAFLILPAGAKDGPAANPAPVAAVGSDDALTSIKSALDEERYVDAEHLLSQALSAGTKDSRLIVLAGELDLARGQSSAALEKFRSVDQDKAVRGQALQGAGIALAMLGRSAEAMSVLQQAVLEDPSAWRAWNALGSEYDRRRDWTHAEAAYDHALVASHSAAIVLNNRGFSRMLQRRLDDATADFVAALKAKPDLAAARTNLRLALAMNGQYDRAVAASGEDGQAMSLNNAAVAAMMRGDLSESESLLKKALAIKGAYYARAEANLEILHTLQAQDRSGPGASDKH